MSKILYYLKEALCDKKIVVVSKRGIVNIPISSKLQLFSVIAVFFFCFWISYSTDKAFLYSEVIYKKDLQITNSLNEKESLEKKVDKLKGNLEEINEYIDSLNEYDQIKKKLGKQSKSIKIDNEIKNVIEEKHSDSQDIISKIKLNVLSRIYNLEEAIDMTGVGVLKVAKSNPDIRKFIPNLSSKTKNQGGVYIPFDDGDFKEDIQYLIELEKAIHHFPLSSPIKKSKLTSGFGIRSDPIRGRKAMHNGIDLVGKHKSEIVSSAPGIIKRAGRNGAYGLFVEVKHKHNITTRYAHLSKLKVKKGQKVSRGDLIGLQGNTGRSTGEHLHYEIRYKNKAIDPKKFLSAGRHVL